MFTVHNHKLVCTTSLPEAIASLHDLANMNSSAVYRSDKSWTPTHNSKARTGLSTPTPKKLGVLDTKKIGKEFSNYFSWRDRANVDKPGSVSINKLLTKWRKDPERARVAMTRVQKYSPDKHGGDLMFYAARMGSSFMSVNMFPPCVAKFFADALQAKHVLDFSAGWLDRLAGFLASPSVQSITLIDPRPSVAVYAKQMVSIARKKLRRTNLQCKVYTTGAEVIMPKMANSKKFDLIMTSPPYFNLEEYDVSSKNAKMQVMATCSNSKEYLDKFLFPVMDAAVKLLSDKGVLAINIDDNYRRGVDVCGPLVKYMQAKKDVTLVGTMALKKNVLVGSTPTSTPGKKGEPFYIWCKGGEATANAVRSALTHKKSLPVQEQE